MADAVSAPPSIESLATPLLLVGDDGRIRYANAGCAAWLGLSARRLQAMHVTQLAGRPVPLAALVERARGHGQPLCARRQQLSGAGGERFADVWASAGDAPVTDDGHGEPGQGAADVCLEFHPIEEFPGEDPATLLPAALSAALRGLAHEVRNPLAGLKGAAQLLARRAQDPESRRYIEVIDAECARLLALVERLLDPALPATVEPVNVHALLERVRMLAEAEAGWAIRIERDYDPSLPDLHGDPARLTQALLNLVRNALQADATEVRLRTRAEHTVAIGEVVHRLAIRIEVADSGRGVPDELNERIFLPLVSGRAEGSGLGLPLAQQIAREHGGSLGFRSRPGHTVFALLLPVREPAADAGGPDAEADASAAPAAPPLAETGDG